MFRYTTVLILTLVSTAQASTFTTNMLTDKVDYHLPYLQNSMVATFTAEPVPGGIPVTWQIGTFTTADVGRTVILNKENAMLDWDLLESYLINSSMLIHTLDGGPLFAQTVWEYPIPGYPIHRDGLVDIKFKLQAFILEYSSQGQSQGYLAGIFNMRFRLGITGDYNRNGFIDTADYIVWRNAVGQHNENPIADGNYDYYVDALDYAVWRIKFEQQTNVGSVVIPEPSNTINILVCVVLLTFVYNHKL